LLGEDKTLLVRTTTYRNLV